jgi:glycosyltransferase involved in cell wall biosynthesis
MTSLISVIIPFFNARDFIERCVTSVIHQQGPTIEIVAVDDGSIDGSGEYLEGLSDSRIRLLRHVENAGVAQARNTGLAAAQGDWVLFLDADDYLLPGCLQRLHSVAAMTDIAFCDWIEIDASSGRKKQCHSWFDADRDHLAQMLAGNCFPIHTILVRRELLERTGGFDTVLQHEDWALWLQVIVAGARFRHVPFTGAVYWRRQESRSADAYERALNDLALLADLDRIGIAVPAYERARLVRDKHYELAQLAFLDGDSPRARSWLRRCEPLAVHERLECFIVSIPLVARLNGRIPGPRKLRRWGQGIWQWARSKVHLEH